jgi:hypothetical protein
VGARRRRPQLGHGEPVRACPRPRRAHQEGWKPLRSIILASWDAEEYGLVGSTGGRGLWRLLQATRRRTSTSTRARWPEPARIRLAVALALLLRGAAEEIEKTTQPGVSVWDARGRRGLGRSRPPSTVACPPRPRASRPVALASGPSARAPTTLLSCSATVSRRPTSPSPADPRTLYHYHSIHDSHHWVKNFATRTAKHTRGGQDHWFDCPPLRGQRVLPQHDAGCRATWLLPYKIEDLKKEAGYDSLDLVPLGDAIKDTPRRRQARCRARRADRQAARGAARAPSELLSQRLAHAFGLAPCPHAEA